MIYDVRAPRPIPPLPRINRCPNCGAFPEPSRCSIFQGHAMRLECRCGVAGPYVESGEWQHQRAYAAWGRVFGQPELKAQPEPKAPAGMSAVRAVP